MELVHRMNAVLDGLGIKARCIAAKQHRHLAFFDIQIQPGTRIRRIELFSREIGLALRSKTAPIIQTTLSEGIVRIKVAFEDAPILTLKSLQNGGGSGILPILMGEADTGESLWVDMSKLPHMLVAGATGSGKSMFLHVLIANALDRRDVDLYIVDPKRGAEFGLYKNAANFIAVDYSSTIFMLDKLTKIMEARYSILETVGISSIEQSPNFFSKILVIIDEVADIMIADKEGSKKGTFEKMLCNLAAKARAAGIYIVLATQRPSVDVITGLIKSNFPARLACKVTTGIDSKVILDESGAESLLGRGDAILKSPGNDLVRFQVAYVDPANRAA